MVRLMLIDGIPQEYRFGNDRKTWQTLLHYHNQCMQMIVANPKFVMFVLLDIVPEKSEYLNEKFKNTKKNI